MLKNAEWFQSITQKHTAEMFLSIAKCLIAKPVKFGLTTKNADTTQNTTGKKFASQNVEQVALTNL